MLDLLALAFLRLLLEDHGLAGAGLRIILVQYQSVFAVFVGDTDFLCDLCLIQFLNLQ